MPATETTGQRLAELELLHRMEALTEDIELAPLRQDNRPDAKPSGQQLSISAALAKANVHGVSG